MQDSFSDGGDDRPAGPVFIALALAAVSLMLGGFWHELAAPISNNILADMAVRSLAAGAGLIAFFRALPRFGVGERVEFSEETRTDWRPVIVIAAASILISALAERGLSKIIVKSYGAAPDCAPHSLCPVTPISDVVEFE